jgi:hypothetical protein
LNVTLLRALPVVLTLIGMWLAACAPPHVVGIDIATPAQLAARPYHVITVVEVRVTPATGGVPVYLSEAEASTLAG